ncbi:MAG: peptidase domain-containing ABC transporter [Tannerella sp.]|jgi:ATP-binding cassette subfamily B protein|nr:peptidase domain-containing ABC transporter [Tannerella sp.]
MKIKQRDITDCGAACLASVAGHYKLKLPISRIRQIAGTDKRGTNVLGMVKAAEQLGYTAKGVRGNTDALPNIPLPAIAHVVLKNGLQHYVVIYQVKAGQIQYMDPSDGDYHKESIEEFQEKWSGVLVLLVPGGNFKTGNEKTSIFQRFMFLLAPHKTVLAASLFGAVIYTVLGLSTSIYIQKITDNVLVNSNENLLNLMSIVMILILVFQIFISVNKSILMLNTGQKIDARLILGYYKHLLRLPQRFFDTMRIGEIISRINDAVKIRIFINDVIISLIVNILIVFFSFALMFVYSWKLALILLICIPLYVVIYIITDRLNKKRERKLMEQSADLESQLVESLNSVRTIKEFGIEDFANLKTENRFVKLMDSVYKSAVNSFFSTNSTEFVSRIFTIIILWVGSYYVIDNAITPGELLSFYALIGYLTNPVSSLIGMNKTVQNALIAADRLFEIMDLERETEENKIELDKGLIGNIVFEHVSFSYGTRVDVFEDFNLTIQKGTVTAIIGESGSGKTTLAALLQKLYPLKSGKILIGEANIEHFDNQSIRTFISSVPQELYLFSGSIIDNIAIGDFSPDIQHIMQICNRLGMLSFIEKLSHGFNTNIGENGSQLSGGQKQRIAIARALYRNPEILILDEATSSLDSESEKFVIQAVKYLKSQGKTVIIIAHRLSTIVESDTIIVLENGKVLEQGNHKELLTKTGAYFQMWRKQMFSLKTKI